VLLPPLPFGVLAESPAWIAIDKPAGLQVHPSKPAHLHTLWHRLRELLAFEIACGGQVSIVNRLDRETSGVVLVAKTAAAAREFGLRMLRREFTKEYFALVWGWPELNAWEVAAPILRQGEVQPSAIYLKRMIHPAGAGAASRFEVISRFSRVTTAGERFSLVKAIPVSGRTHQLRLHLAHSGHPVVGDKIYGPDEGCYLEFIETGWTPALAKRLLLPRHALHASSLRLERVGLAWAAPLPADMQAFMAVV
jgi:23S rRNA pseudouridine1911/1915/1917 synthase